MVQILPYIIPLLLGRTIDLNKMEVGVDIFHKDQVLRPVILRNPASETTYKVVDNTVEARNLLDVGGSFSLNVKGGVFKAGAAGEYLSDTYNRENTVEVAVKATYEMVTEQLPPDAKPLPSWNAMGALGTHYVRSVTYGGELIASVRMICNSTRDKKRIKGAFEIGGRIDIFDLGIEAEGEYMKDVSKSIETTQVKVFSSIPISKVPGDMQTLKKMLDDYPKDLKTYNKGRGVPLYVELWPLNYLNSSRPAQISNSILEAELNDFEQKFDDLLNTKSAIADWMKILSKPLSKKHEDEVGKLYGELQEVLRKFYEVIGKLDMSQGTGQLRPAVDAYGGTIPGIFYNKYLNLRQKSVNDQGDWVSNRGTGASYIHWGRQNCSHVAEAVLNGAVYGSDGKIGGANFICMPDLSEAEQKTSEIEDAILLQGAFFDLPDKVRTGMSCSECYLRTKGTVRTFPGRTDCPRKWETLYDGLMMTGNSKDQRTSFICLDKHVNDDNSATAAVPMIPNFVADAERKAKLLPCIVCAK